MIWIVLAAIFKATADKLSHHFEKSIFKNLNPKWWNPNVSWEYVKFIPFTKYRPDAWHIANSLMIVCFAIAAFGITLKMLVTGVVFILIFNLFYNKIYGSN
jgi:hypothetical protein